MGYCPVSLLIDGYNLLNTTGIVASGGGPRGLQQSRLAMLNFLAESLPPEELAQTTVVFDAHDPPRGLPRVLEHRGLTVRFASQYANADELIEELIQADSAPRRLTVVSSDHRVHRAARRRKAAAIDSDAWYARLRQRRRQAPAAEAPERPPLPLLEEDVDYWVRQFGGQSLLEKLIADG
jgi:predicted RNA-binding protein with PIN domain